jgi:patatin-like phospholipase/acyl hydrolase
MLRFCTIAAPVYFPPHQHPTYGLCIDGGVFANNPSTLALARVLNSGILEDRNIENIRILSVGTGQTQNRMRPEYQPDGPLKYWTDNMVLANRNSMIHQRFPYFQS